MQHKISQVVHRLDEHMRVNRITQADIAQEVGVDQATVSRFLSKKKPPQRITAASQRLYEYVQKAAPVAGKSKQQPTDARSALELCLNKSVAHARAAAKILTALAELCDADSKEVASG
jgi:predicted transcriptional regulator